MMMHAVLMCMEMCMMVAAVPLCLMLPGAMFAMWMCACAVVVMAMCWMLNGSEQMHQCTAGSEGWMMGPESEDEKWMFMGGMGMSPRHCHQMTLPALSRLFSRPMTCICMPTYGLPLDTVMMMLQRCMPMPSQARRNLYAQMRCALLDDSMNRCVVMAHNHSSIIVSQAVAQLCADIPAEKLRKLEIYTFGSAAGEFMMPLGEENMEAEPMHQSPDSMHERKGIHVEHFAMMNDPFAKMGVLGSIRMNMDGRYCGGVFIMNQMSSASSSSKAPSQMCMGLTMEDYLMELFPNQMAGSSSARSVLDGVMMIDRDCAEKREFAAMSNYNAVSKMKKNGGKRLSWTGLATMAGQKNGMSAGMAGLEMARKGCKNCDGHTGREVSWLARHCGMSPMMMGAKHMSKNNSMGRGD
ncbi:hypothetical protein B0H63DRAFT_495379 [Podospora didyma]|uniref:Uncharacterized protein n=1 Tax=Podospora didyma TaxID=330526 RepID=A0AAE0NI97_9PEZI|nr:hypothetical protein B0H63DRAFT_495379 [Podospora didyma]